MRLISSIPLKISNSDVVADFTLASNQTADFILEYGDEQDKQKDLEGFVKERLFQTVNYWKDGSLNQTIMAGGWRSLIARHWS